MVDSCEVLAVGAHPDDVELGCGGTVARLADSGRVVGILDLTAGELATRGEVSERAAEAASAAAALGAAWRACLTLPDCGLGAGDEDHRRAVVSVLRSARPRVVFVHDLSDPHPDHGAAATLLREACFLAGVARFEPQLGEAWRPALVLAYPGPRQLLVPALVIDVTAWYEAKRRALAAHSSQFDPTRGAATHIASGVFLSAIEGRDRACGNTASCELGEGFAALGPLPADELRWLLEET